ncbi:Cytochrome P450 family protein [Melia azedarach]|uniref:Cytochrome P450 family protein n=1 Tax=Melia azedarach TaxID=155640 RepID=A0ACC1YFT6_MELAZ|nr:Cytochrome P450 family protein [Melia azedarach]
MPEKVVVPSPKQRLLLGAMHQWRFGVLTALVFLGMVVVWSIDGCTVSNFIEAWKFKQDHYLAVKANAAVDRSQIRENLAVNTSNFRDYSTQSQNLYQNQINVKNFTFNASPSLNLTQNNQTAVTNITSKNSGKLAELEHKPSRLLPNRSESQVLQSLKWVAAELESDLTSNLLARWLAPGGEPCKDSRTVEIAIRGLDGGKMVELSAGEIHEFYFQALDEFRNPRCIGGDYFEIDLSGESWKSRPVVKDFGNGTYSLSLQVHPDFVGRYNLTVILLFRHFEGLKFSPARFVYDKELRHMPITFFRSKAQLPELKICQKSDFTRDVWSGRWTRHGKNDDCQISNDGRYRCLAQNFPCQKPWCYGSLGMIESNGWVYSSHCSFRMYSAKSAWNCLKNRWIFFWGDSNHVDTLRNMLNFVLDLPDIKSVPRRFDMNFSNPKDPSQSVRITSIFNGHWNETQNYLGLDSLKDEGFRNLLKKYFSEDTVPDTMIMNSGLHDGVHFSNIRAFSKSAYYAASFWKEVIESVRNRGLAVPQIFYRTTVATGGYARALAFNPNKMEAYNGVVLDKFRQAALISGVIDDFDMTFPWHFDNRCNDGVHYGRAPLKMRWRDGQIGHQYFVDLMLAHVLLNALCAK